MALRTRHLPRPTWLQGVTSENTTDYSTKCALAIFKDGRLSAAPCDLCVKNNEVCIVARRSGRCMRCTYNDVRVLECQAEGVSPMTKPDIPPPAKPITSESKAAVAQPDAKTIGQSVFQIQINSNPAGTSDPRGKTKHRATVKQKRKRRVSDPTDSIEIEAKRPRRPTQAVTPTFFEPPYVPTAGETATCPSNQADESATTQNVETIRWAPLGSIDYDLRIRTEDPAAWAQWAVDLHKEIHSLRHVQDLGPYTMGITEMMKEDGVWPGEMKCE